MFDWYYKVILNYTNFNGRARRQEYWYFTLVNVLVNLVMGIIDRVIGSVMQMDNFGFFGVIYALFIMIPSIAVTVRRLHDSGRTGWWALIAFVPVIGILVLLYFLIQDSEEGSNQYGVSPKYQS
ncbi:DUF805 domain-containing protein [Vibrio rotiferianus]|jgi:uncharacterized membrane protein YhaH (DUF805 family)|uniref:DUF805 domain-containing protein n=1 Tax=Vibrio rotiferianus TaxID=190895 RepID=A0ABX3DCB9_9VIBR|nr:DUF805 domain-containing protein [Vibrio rotiferianus]ASI94320.1 hypothetical protein BSZ04_04695 [Vibrio rotiferianus]NOH66921.1 DUF805 domain-containing protein [Vibrio rotiferianus]OHY94620.1 hypothetical protein BI375_16100 [Vibrio rotiferianus]PIB13815.1 hypothetical protein B853_16704 [Vibrio rotiferianus CAIM 577 = LMG 21460]CAH1545404.1 putative inner membrane protein [Vibrio rotiferianus]